MQGTIVMLMALSGVGCHHRGCAPAYGAGYYGTDACYSSTLSASCYSGCYASNYGGSGACYGGCYSSYYGAGYSSCYGGGSGGCYGGRKHCGLFSGFGGGLFGGGGLCGHKNRGGCYGGGCYGGGYAYDAMPAYDCYAGSAPAVFGSYTPVGPVYATGQAWGSGQSYPTSQTSNYGTPIPGSPGVYSTTRATAIPTSPAPGAAIEPVPPTPTPAEVTRPVPAAPAPGPGITTPPVPIPGGTVPPIPGATTAPAPRA